MKRFLLLAILIGACSAESLAQSASAIIAGTVLDEAGKPLAGIPVMLLKAADSSLFKLEASDAAGKFRFEGLPAEKFLVKAEGAGRPARFSAVAEAAGTAVPVVLTLGESAAKSLGEVAIRAQKPLIEVRADKTILNVDASPVNAGSTAFEVLQRAPGVTVDGSDAFSLKGRPGVTIMMDGRIIPLRGADLANLLRGMPSGSIDKIELISNPGSRYDAAGTGGIIHIRTKKDQKLGANGTASLTGGYGIYPKAGAGLSANYRAKKFNVFSSINAAQRQGFSSLDLFRKFYTDGRLEQAYVQDNYARINYGSAVLNAGVDYSASSKTTLGAAFNGTAMGYTFTGDNHSEVLDASLQPASYFNTQTDNNNRWKNAGINLNLRHTFDSTGRELSVDADAARYFANNDQNLFTQYHWLNGAEQRTPYALYGALNGSTSIYVAKADYVHPLKNGLKLEAGFKSSLVTADNKPVFYDRSGGGNVYDSGKSNHFIYTENINAAYVNAAREWPKWGIQAGLRVENTRAEGEQKVYNQTFIRDYTQLFPSLILTHHLTKTHDLGVSVSRRIERPTYQQLNPFREYFDPSSVHQGNPYLNPALTYSVEITHTFKSKWSTSVGWSRTEDVIAQIIQPEAARTDSIQVTSISDQNLAVNTLYGFNGSYPLQPSKWWNATVSFSAFYSRYEGDLVNTPLADGTAALQLSATNTLTLPKGLIAEVSGWYQTKQRYGYMLLRDMYSLNVGVQKSFFDKRFTAKLSGTDLLWRQNARGRSTFRDYDEDFVVYRDSRTAMLTLTYRFGKRTVAPIRRRAPGAEEERRRAGGGGGAA